MADFYPASSSDDVYLSGSIVSSGALTIGYSYSAYIRFPNINIPNNAKILTANLSLYAYADDSDTVCRLGLFADNVDSATVPTAVSGFYGASANTRVEWVIPTVSQHDEITSPSIVSSIQTVIDRSGWISGNAIGLLLINAASSTNVTRLVCSYEDSGYQPKLTITWQASDGKKSLSAVSSASTDDFYVRPSYSSSFLYDSLAFGKSNYSSVTYIRFNNVNIPQGSTINSAKIGVKAAYATDETVNVNIYGIDVDSATVPANYTELSALALTDPVAWNDVEEFEAYLFYESPDVSDIIQSIINREGWVSGNSIAILFKDNDSTTFRQIVAKDSYDYGCNPALFITYTPAGSTTSTLNVTLPMQTVESGSNGISATLPSLSLDGYVEVPFKGMAADLPMLTLDAAGVTGEIAECAVDIPILTISSTSIQGTVSTCSCTIPMFTVNDTEMENTTKNLDESLPMLTLSAYSLTGQVCSGDCDIPFLDINASLLTGTKARGNIILPIYTIKGRTSNIGIFNESLPFFSVEGYAHGPLVSTLNVTLPIFEIAAYLKSSSTEFKSYALNTKNNALTEYENYNFNSFCVFQGKSIGASSSGLMILEGASDNGTDIDASLNVGITDFRLANLKKITDVYLSVKGNGNLTLTVTTDDGVSTDYNVITINTRTKTSKANIGKGKKGRYWELAISNVDGSDFELHDINLNVELLGRKV